METPDRAAEARAPGMMVAGVRLDIKDVVPMIYI